MKNFKSKIIKEFDFREADVSGEDFTYEVDKKFIEKEILRIRKKNKISCEVNEINKGDIAVCFLKSNNSKFNKERITINIGLGLFKKEVETALLGMKKDESKIIYVDSERVAINVLNITRSEIPELTDEMALQEKIEEVYDIESLMEHLNNLYKERKNAAISNKSYYLIENVLKQVVANSEFDIDEEDIQHVCDLEVQKARVLCENEGMDLEKMTPEEFDGKIPVKSYDEFLNMVYNMKKEQMPVILFGIKHAMADGYKISLEEYDKEIKEYYTMYNLSPEIAKRAISFDLYEANGYSRYYRKRIEEYYKERYQEV